MNIITRIDFVLASYDVTAQNVSHYTAETSNPLYYQLFYFAYK